VRFGLLACAVSVLIAAHPEAISTMPSALSDQDFWSLMANASEPAGSFLSENLVSNESHLAEMIHLMGAEHRGGVYIGVGPEQNFSYIARLQPQMAFVVDIRRENRDLHLMYKALFEISRDRADFVSRLFSRPRPSGIRPDGSVAELFDAFASVDASHALFASTLQAVRDRLVSDHHLPLAIDQLQWIEHVLSAFYADGPAINYWRTPATADVEASTREVRDRVFSYAGLMMAKDESSAPRSYLASERSFRIVKELEEKNLIVPIVGDFAGDRALTAVARYVQDHGATVSLFYGSNVPDVLTPDQLRAFCRNLAALRDTTGPHSFYIGADAGDADDSPFAGFSLFSKAMNNCSK
jgi:hypothetical protein